MERPEKQPKETEETQRNQEFKEQKKWRKIQTFMVTKGFNESLAGEEDKIQQEKRGKFRC